MVRRVVTFFALLAVVVGSVSAQDRSRDIKKIDLYHSDYSEFIFTDEGDTVYAIGSVIFSYEGGLIYCDSTVYVKGKSAILRGNVILDDTEYRLAADSVLYDIASNEMVARGSYVELWSREDSLFAVGTHAFFNRDTDYFRMEERPTVFFNYPDSSSMIEIIADLVEYDSETDRASCEGDVVINNKDMSSSAGRALMYPEQDRLELYDAPELKREKSTVTGKVIVITTEDDIIKRIDVSDSARAVFSEPTDPTELFFDESILTGENLVLDFEEGQLDRLTCSGQAYSWYLPSSKGGSEYNENTASGDSILFSIENEELTQVDVIGGAVGTYVTGKTAVPGDSTAIATVDTVDYNAEKIRYRIVDSLITLNRQAHVISGGVSLDAEKILFDTKDRMIEAFSAAIVPDTAVNPYELSAQHEPNEIPVRLKDGESELFGDHLEYSIDTEKGRIIQSKSAYERGMYYGENAYRASKKVFYVKKGLYTPCDVNYLHFWSHRMKLIEGEKLIAKPVIMYVGRIPVIALPYYVFPLKKGRHSGFLPFTIGNIEAGQDRYIRNVGYYWAASEYWDWQGALDYYEQNSRINTFQKLQYKKLYSFDGYIEMNYARRTDFSSLTASEAKTTSWTLKAYHNHQISPSFKLSARGDYQNDATYYQNYSVSLEDRLNRTTRSELNFTKQFSKSVSLSGKFSHDLNLDTRSRTSTMPSMSISVPVIYPFGSGSMNDDGRLEQKWYNKLTVRVSSPRLTNFSSRITVDSVKNELYDTTIVVDTLTLLEDTTITLVSADTLSYRSRKEYTRVDNGLTVSFPNTIAKYVTFNPSFRYSENWHKVHETDQSLAAEIDASKVYRSYIYTLSTSLSTKLYGTVYPNVAGLRGFRQVITPTVSYSYTPEINENPEVRSFAGGGAGSSREVSSMGVSLNHYYQAKVASGEAEKNLELMSITHSFSYDFRDKETPYSNLSTRFSSNVLPKVTFSGGMTHSFYEPDTDNLKFWSPFLLNFDLNASLTIGGKNFLFDDPGEIPRGSDSPDKLAQGTDQARSSGGKGWSFSMTYSYNESGRGEAFQKSAFTRFNLAFNLTPETSVSYSQYYDFERGRTINSSVNITRRLNCWTGNFFWVPVGSNRGFGFRIFVTAIPAIKIDNSSNPLDSDYFQQLR